MTPKMFYVSLGDKVLRIGRTTTNRNNYKSSSYETLISRIINQKAKSKRI